jgi:taurine dioxygenase
MRDGDAGLEVRPFDAALGAEVRCADIRRLSGAGIREVRQAWLDHVVVLFRDQQLSDEDLVRFGERFGEFQVSNALPSPLAREGRVRQGAGRDERFPQVTVVSNVVEDGIALGGLGDGELVWHTDMNSFEIPPDQTILYGIEIPAAGGRTGFTNMYEAWESLPADLKARVRHLQIKHDATIDAAGYLRRDFADAADGDIRTLPGAVHPLVRTHPETGRDSLYLGRRTRTWLVGLPVAESDALLDELWAHATRPALTWFHEWRPGDVLMWDNRCAMHYREPFDEQARRTLHRVVIRGSRPFHDPAAASRGAHPRGRARASA